MAQSLRQVLLAALSGLLKPIARFCVTRSIKIQDFVEVAKKAFVEAAAAEVARQDKEASVSRLSVMTGVHRREVMRIWSEDSRPKTKTDLVVRVMGTWQADRHFSARGKPRVLSLEGKDAEFKALVRSVSQDLNPYTVLFELERAGAVERVKNGVRLRAGAFRPSGGLKDKLELLARDTRDLIQAIEENVFDEPEIPNLHIKTEYDNIPRQFVPKIREWLLRRGAEFHEEARRFLAQFDADLNDKLQGKAGGVRAAIGSFSVIEDPHGSSEEE